MKTHHHPATFVHLINQVGLLGICVALVVAFYYQLVRHELPCPICLLQRAGLIIAGFGFYLTSALVYEVYITGW